MLEDTVYNTYAHSPTDTPKQLIETIPIRKNEWGRWGHFDGK